MIKLDKLIKTLDQVLLVLKEVKLILFDKLLTFEEEVWQLVCWVLEFLLVD